MADFSWIKQPPTTGANVDISFGADYNYGFERGLFNHKEIGTVTGAAKLGSGGHSISRLTGVEGIVTDSTDSADLKLFRDFDVLIKSFTKSKDKCKLRYYLNPDGSYAEFTGWVTNYSASRDVHEGKSVIRITFDFLVESIDYSNLN